MSFTLGQTTPTVGPNAAATAAVPFSLQTREDSGDGLALATQIAPDGEPEHWIFTAAGVASFGIDEVTSDSGRLTGSFTSEIGGRTEVMVFDTATGELLDAAALPDDAGMSLVDGDTTTQQLG